MNKPYIRLIDQRGNINIWIVDGEWVRTNIDEQFTNYDQPLHATYIPVNEFWIDQEAAGDETRYYIDGLMVEYRLMQEGESYDTALEKSDDIVRRERKKDEQENVRGTTLAALSLYIEKLGSADGVEVWLVSGELVRDLYDMDFTEGGHGLVYKYIPDNQVWIDDDVESEERLFIILHELYERMEMAAGRDYEAAHLDASDVELRTRHDETELDDELYQIGWEEA